MLPDDPRHGSVEGFHAGCNCEPCRLARSKDEKFRRHEARIGNPRRVPALGTQRRIQALMRLGWSTDALATAGGWASDREVQNLLYARRYVYRATAQRVEALYEQLSMTLGPSEQTRSRAEAAGYAPPLAYDDIDNPNEEPNGIRGREPNGRSLVDPVVVDELLAGRRVDSTREERVAAMTRWLAWGRSEKSLCELHGWKDGRYVVRERVAS